ncbi:hypothetical protein B0H17DRAFT_1199886 [Mycena rosella]|uniref:Extracellular serine-rich protein n=1 Tax=Mycena rosella TaxID=1033263 RepID=A0AAD7DJU1_MYCRO|nr:hypothetical protein B0H17DRAFT_1199886 [Mycena rosella]
MRFSLAVAALAPAVSVYAANIQITVGGNNLLAFSPSNITAAAGDLRCPCTPITGTPNPPLDSGFQPVNSSGLFPQFSFTMGNDTTTPLWFFCAQTTPADHCNAGMVFSVNANEASAKSFSAFQTAAKTATPGAAAPAANGTTTNGTSTTGSGTNTTGTNSTGTGSGKTVLASASALRRRRCSPLSVSSLAFSCKVLDDDG